MKLKKISGAVAFAALACIQAHAQAPQAGANAVAEKPAATSAAPQALEPDWSGTYQVVKKEGRHLFSMTLRAYPREASPEEVQEVEKTGNAQRVVGVLEVISSDRQLKDRFLLERALLDDAGRFAKLENPEDRRNMRCLQDVSERVLFLCRIRPEARWPDGKVVSKTGSFVVMPGVNELEDLTSNMFDLEHAPFATGQKKPN